MSTYTKTRLIILLKIIIFFSSSASAQVSLKEIGLHPGHYPVGFRHETAFDSTRLYKRSGDWNNLSIPRPIPPQCLVPRRPVDSKNKSGKSPRVYEGAERRGRMGISARRQDTGLV
ncbi:hypothetical protein OQY15_11295 [Pedobacter sp. MC2016-15]|uniref:hypothetical protein n=1 Tax=Pedobacter sp. MC2016-15 TaxID=2994473 RepID=UPI002246C15F|nr:hypothetical protein [Pedobacter sp. MC2016-15]MCX2479672.1 hypothetical protein [Pedobacter sp. MC2016-15]